MMKILDNLPLQNKLKQNNNPKMKMIRNGNGQIKTIKLQNKIILIKINHKYYQLRILNHFSRLINL